MSTRLPSPPPGFDQLAGLGLSNRYAVPSVRVTNLSLHSLLEATIVAGIPTLMLITYVAERLLDPASGAVKFKVELDDLSRTE